MDIPEQGANGIPVTSISLKDSKLTFAVASIQGSYRGKVDADGTSIEGIWSQGQPLPLKFKRATRPSDIDGAWSGALDAGAKKLRIVFHIANTQDGLVATMESPDEGGQGLPVTVVTRNGALLTLEMKQIGGKFEGKIANDLTTIEGTWTQGGNTLPMVLKRGKNAGELERRRPQNPAKPYPYREEEVAYANPAARIQLAATLTIPPGEGRFPAVFLITGSGQQDRDESLSDHRPFLVLADYLTRKGIAVLRADDRGFGKSGGVFATATTADFATDAEAAVAYLEKRPEIDPHRIGLVGHSEGGTIAAMVAARDRNVAFIVMMAGWAAPGDEILAGQIMRIAEAGGMSHEEAEKNAADERDVLALVKQGKSDAVIEKKLRETLAAKLPDAQVAAQIQGLRSPWLRYFLEYDPTTALKKVTCPVLAINGEKDLQVSAAQNLPVIRKALEAAGNQNFEVVELQGLNHLFQTAKTGSPNEYAEIEETISPLALEKIASWIAGVLGPGRGSERSARPSPSPQ